MIETPPRLVLVTPRRFDPVRLAPALADMLAAADVAALILDLTSEAAEAWRAAGAALCPVSQRAGTAFLVRDRVELAAELGADGVHVTGGPAALDAALRAVPPDAIVGAGDCTIRHAAMVLGERQPSYVFLGRLDADGDRAATPTLVEWWSELFELPGVALAADEWKSIEQAAFAGADFIAVRDLIWADGRGPLAALRDAAHARSAAREAAA